MLESGLDPGSSAGPQVGENMERVWLSHTPMLFFLKDMVDGGLVPQGVAFPRGAACPTRGCGGSPEAPVSSLRPQQVLLVGGDGSG